jgi:hypothetical protein
MGIAPGDLLGATPRPPAPTFAEYIPIVASVVSAGTRRVYGSYWNFPNIGRTGDSTSPSHQTFSTSSGW